MTNLNNVQKIIVHGGQFHADDIIVIALLRLTGVTAPVERLFKVSQEDLDNPQVIVADVGNVYDEGRLNFDHHQDTGCPASCVLVYKFLVKIGLLKADETKHLYKMLKRVSNLDRGIGWKTSKPTELNVLLRSFNSLGKEGFELAVNTAAALLRAEIETGRKAAEDRNRSLTEISVNGSYGIQHTNNPIMCWKQELNIKFLITPGREPGQYNLISRDSSIFPIEKDEEQLFLHPSKFMAVYNSHEAAENAAKRLS